MPVQFANVDSSNDKIKYDNNMRFLVRYKNIKGAGWEGWRGTQDQDKGMKEKEGGTLCEV